MKLKEAQRLYANKEGLYLLYHPATNRYKLGYQGAVKSIRLEAYPLRDVVFLDFFEGPYHTKSGAPGDKLIHDVLRKRNYQFFKSTLIIRDTEWCELPYASYTSTDFINECKDIVTDIYEKPKVTKKFILNKNQNDAVEKWNNNIHQKFLLGAQMRFGKTITCFTMFKEFLEKNPEKDICLFLSARLDVKMPLYEDFYNWRASDKIGNPEIELADLRDVNFMSDDDTNHPYILFTSIQHSSRTKGFVNFFEDYEERFKNIKDRIGMVIFDEAQIAGNAPKTNEFFNWLQPKRILFISGMPYRLRGYGDFCEENEYLWDLISEKEDIEKPNLIMPDGKGGFRAPTRLDLPELIFIKGNDPTAGLLSFKQWIETSSENDIITFIKSWIPWLEKNNVKNFIVVGPTGTISNDKKEKQSAGVLKKLDKCIRIAFGYNVKREANVFLAAAENRNDDYFDKKGKKNRTTKIKNLNIYESFNTKCEKEPDKYNILISLGKGLQAVTYKKTVAVFMLNNLKSPELYMQGAFRCKNADKENNKTKCYCVDFNGDRVLEIIYSAFSAMSKNRNGGKFSKEIFEKYLSNFTYYDINGEPIANNFEELVNIFVRNINLDKILSEVDDNDIEYNNINFAGLFLGNKIRMKMIDEDNETNEDDKDINKRKGNKTDYGLNETRPDEDEEDLNATEIRRRRIEDHQKKQALNHALSLMPNFFKVIGNITSRNDFLNKIQNSKNIFQHLVKLDSDLALEMFENGFNDEFLERLIYKWQDSADNNEIKWEINSIDTELSNIMVNNLKYKDGKVLIFRGCRGFVEEVKKVTNDWVYVTDNYAEYLKMNAYYGENYIIDWFGEKREDIDKTNILIKNIKNIIKDMNFKYVIMNPPYGSKHLPILKTMVEEVVDKNDGRVVSIQPIRWLQMQWRNFNNDSKYLFLKNKTFIDIIKNGFDNFDAFGALDLGIYTIDNKIKKDNLEKIIFKQRGVNFKWALRIYKQLNGNSLQKEKYINQKNCVPIRNILVYHGIEKDVPNLSKLWKQYGYVKNGVLEGGLYDGVTFEYAKNNNGTTGTTGDVIVFNNENEPKNFFYYLQLQSFRFFAHCAHSDVNAQIKYLPFIPIDHDWSTTQWDSSFGNEYEHKSYPFTGIGYHVPITDEMFRAYFSITEKESKIIEETMKDIIKND